MPLFRYRSWSPDSATIGPLVGYAADLPTDREEAALAARPEEREQDLRGVDALGQSTRYKHNYWSRHGHGIA
jgi:hypothetical protein